MLYRKERGRNYSFFLISVGGEIFSFFDISASQPFTPHRFPSLLLAFIFIFLFYTSYDSKACRIIYQ
jgi:hypothetical protein